MWVFTGESEVRVPTYRLLAAIAATAIVTLPSVSFAKQDDPPKPKGDDVHAVPGPVEGVGFPFIMAGGAVALALAARKRRGS
jgi:hypothetical protein